MKNMKKKRYLLLLLLALASLRTATGQTKQRALPPQLDLIAKPESTADWIDFRDDAEVSPATLFADYSTYFGLSGQDEMRVTAVQNDELGYAHYRYQQYAHGYKVTGAEFIVHVNASNHTYAANGRMVKGLRAPVPAAVSATAALQKAQRAMGATAWCWESEYWENEIREHTGKQEASYVPRPELVWFHDLKMNDWNPEVFRLAWVMDLYASSPHKAERYYVSAATGEIIAKVPLESNCNAASVNTIFNGNRGIYTTSGFLGLPPYTMQNDCQTASWNVMNWGSTTSTANPAAISNSTNTWTTNNERFGGSINWEIERCYTYYQAVHGRNSYDNANGDMTAYINAVFSSPGGDYTDNASMSFTGGVMKVGLGSSGTLANSWSTLDIIAHEYTHAVTGASANLTYSYESGALNESFSDIFGEAIENYITGSNDWLMGDQRSSGAIRSFSNPNTYNQPDTYTGTNWYTGTGDNGGVHYNSGVMNYWFYLLTMGGSGTNDKGQTFTVSGIGLSAARAIAYRNLTVYLNSSSQYIDAREGAIRAANDLYGSCSNQSIQTGAAWFAVGVGNTLPQFNYLVACGVTSLSGTISGINTLSTAGGCNTGANPTLGNVIFSATGFVDLKDGFTAYAAGSNYFTAWINPCSYTTYRLAAPDHDIESPVAVSAETETATKTTKPTFRMNVWPNPCREQSELSFVIEAETPVRIILYDQKGAAVTEIDAGRTLPAGIHRYHLETTALPPGQYQIVLQLGAERLTRALIKNE